MVCGVSKEGEKKTAALRKLRIPVEAIGRDMVEKWKVMKRNKPHLHFSFEGFFGGFDEISSL